MDATFERWLPEHEFAEHHETAVNAGLAIVDPIARSLDLRASFMVRALFALRSLGARDGLGLDRDAFLRAGFVLLEDVPNERLVLGLAGRFWRLDGGVRRLLDAEEFLAFDEPGELKAVMDVALEPLGPDRTRVVTETRVHATDDSARRRFRRYWFFVRPFSGLVRREMLRAIRRGAERKVKAVA